MGYALAFVGLIATVQGVAWIGLPRVGTRRRGQGMVLAPLGLLLFIGGLLHALVPQFWQF